MRAGDVEVRGEFLWPAGMKEAPVRRRGREAPRDAELIAPEEIGAAVVLILRKEYRVREEELIDRTARVLGYSRTGPRVRECVERAVALLTERGAHDRGGGWGGASGASVNRDDCEKRNCGRQSRGCSGKKKLT